MTKEIKKELKKALNLMMNNVDYFDGGECENDCFVLEDGTKIGYCDFLVAFEDFIKKI